MTVAVMYVGLLAIGAVLAFVPGSRWRPRSGGDRAGRWWSLAALVWTVVVGVFWVAAPPTRVESISTDSNGVVTVEQYDESLLASEGLGVLVVLAVPVLLAAVALWAPRLRRARAVRFTVGGLLLFACLLGAASIGLAYLPAALAVLVAGALSRRAGPAAEPLAEPAGRTVAPSRPQR